MKLLVKIEKTIYWNQMYGRVPSGFISDFNWTITLKLFLFLNRPYIRKQNETNLSLVLKAWENLSMAEF